METAQDFRESPEARYANYFKLSHGTEELLVDFGQVFSENDTPSFHIRIVMPPSYAEQLWTMLGEVLSHYRKIRAHDSERKP